MVHNRSFKKIYLESLKKNYFKDLMYLLVLFCLFLFLTMIMRQRLILNDSSELERFTVMATALILTLLLNGLLKLTFFYTLGLRNKNHLHHSFKLFLKNVFIEWVNVEIRVQLRVLITFIISLIPFLCLFIWLSPVAFTELLNVEIDFKTKIFAGFCFAVPIALALIENTRLSLSSLHVFYNEKMKSPTFDPITASRTFMTLKKWMLLLPLIVFDILFLYINTFFESESSLELFSVFSKGLKFILIFSFLSYLYYIFLHTLYVLSSKSETILKNE